MAIRQISATRTVSICQPRLLVGFGLLLLTACLFALDFALCLDFDGRPVGLLHVDFALCLALAFGLFGALTHGEPLSVGRRVVPQRGTSEAGFAFDEPDAGGIGAKVRQVDEP